jgi:AraC family transcriptional regulator, transcriptional activator of pobA
VDKPWTKKTIPVYSLQQTSDDGNNHFEIREFYGARITHRSDLFLPHRKDYYFFFLVKKGANRHWIDFVSYDVLPGYLYFTLPHQVHLKEQHAPVDGTLIAFTDDFLLTEEQRELINLPIIRNPDDLHSLKISGKDQDFLTHLFSQMQEEYNNRLDWSNGMLQSYLKIFLLYVSRLYTRQFNFVPTPSGNQSLLRRMKELLNDKYDTLHQVADYAQLLNVTPGHLNDTIRDKTGQNATSLIQQRITLEAKRALFHAELSVKEIGYSLGFEDPAYFNRFFKRVTGETPAGFRNRLRRPQKVPLNPS